MSAKLGENGAHPASRAVVSSRDLEPVRRAILTMVRQGDYLTARQLAVLLIVGTDLAPHTVRGLAATLHVPKSTITRSVDRLAALSLARRLPDPEDGRSVRIALTLKGGRHVRKLAYAAISTQAAA